MNKKLKLLSEHNAEAWQAHKNINNPVLNGIACPECGKELYDSNPMAILTSSPPQKNVHCSNKKCGYIGYRVA